MAPKPPVKRITADRVPPTGKWVQRTPNAGSTVSGIMYLEILAVDNRAMGYVQFYLNGEDAGFGLLYEESARGGVYSAAINTKSFPNGTYNVAAYLAPASGPGMTKNLGAITIENASRPSLAISNIVSGQTVTLPLTVTIEVDPDGETVSDVLLYSDSGDLETLPVQTGPTTWTAEITEWLNPLSQTVSLTAAMELGSSARIASATVLVVKDSFYGAVSVSYALSATSLSVGDTLTITPTVTGDTTDISIVYDFNSDFTDDVVAPGPESPVSYAYPAPGTFTPTARVERDGLAIQTDSLAAVTVSVAAGDTTPPLISVATPANGATVTGAVSYSYDVSDNVGVSLVVPTINGAAQGQIVVDPASASTTVTGTFDTSSVADGALTIGGVAYDAAGNSATAADVVVTVDNTVDPPPDPADGWYDWATEQPFTAMTETRRNITGGTVDKAPISFMVSFHPGEIPTTKTLQLRDPSNNIVPTTHWQFDSRVTYPDGSLSKAWVRVLGPVGLAQASSVQYTVESISGSWPAETNSRTISDVTDGSEFWIELDDIRLIGKPQSSTAQNPYTNPTLEFRLNRALNVPQRTRKCIAGPLVTGWHTREKLQAPGGGTGDAELWVECWAYVWRDPDTGAVVHRAVYPLLYNGWARVRGYAKAFKMRAMNGATVLRNYATTLDLTAASFDVVSTPIRYSFTSNATDFLTFDFRQGSCVKVSGSPPSGITAGKIYPVSKFNGGVESGTLHEYQGKPYLSLQRLRTDGSNFRSGSVYDPVNPGTGGGTFTLTGYHCIFDQQCFAIRDGSGANFWLTGGGELAPYWTRAEKIRRFQTGHLLPIPIEEIATPHAPFDGHSANTPKNTSFIPRWNNLHRYYPGGTNYHRAQMETSGEWYQQGRHLNEISISAFDVLNDMANPSIPWDRILRMSAAEAICFQKLNVADNALDANGNEYAHPLIVNNGPSKNGSRYANCGPCWPNAHAWNAGSSSTGIQAPSSGSGSEQENEMSQWSYGGDTGSHGAKDFLWTYAFYGDPSDLRACQSQFTRHLIAAANGVGPYAGAPLYGQQKTYNGTTYYCVSMPATSDMTQPRSPIGRLHMLSHAMLTPDNDPLGQYFKDIAADNVGFLEAIYDDNTVLGVRARTLGPMVRMPNGSLQAWQTQRVNLGALAVLKRSGIVAPKTLKYLTAFSRWLVGHADNGAGYKQSQSGFNGAVFGIAIFAWGDKALYTTNPTSSDARSYLARFLDDATTDVYAEKQSLGVSPEGNATFTTAGRWQVNFDRTNTWLANGDEVLFIDDPHPAAVVPTGVSKATRYYVYDRQLVSGNTYSYRLSSTPGPSYTQVTWSIGANININRDYLHFYYASVLPGDTPSGLWEIEGISAAYRDYLNNVTASLNVGYTFFGDAFPKLTDAAAAFRTYENRLIAELGKNYWDRKKSFGSWCMHRAYGPGAT